MQNYTGPPLPHSRIIQSQVLMVPRLGNSALQTFPKVCFMEHLYHEQGICAQIWEMLAV